MAEKSFLKSHVNPMTRMQTDLHLDSWNDEMFVHTHQPDAYKRQIADRNKTLQGLPQRGRARLVASVPIEIHDEWEREYQRGAHKNMEWETFFSLKINSPEFRYFKTIPGKV